MIQAIAAAVFLGMAILFTGIAVESGLAVAVLFAVLNWLLFALNLAMYMHRSEGRPPTG